MGRSVKKVFLLNSLKLLRAVKNEHGEDFVRMLNAGIPIYEIDEVIDRLDEAIKDFKGDITIVN